MDGAVRAMSHSTQLRSTLLGVVCLAHWFFGNLYEAVVISPNWVVDSAAQLERLNRFFVLTSPTAYFIVVTQLACALVWLLAWFNQRPELRRDYRRAGALALAAALLNLYIVAALIRVLFGHDFQQAASQLHAYAWRWNLLNLLRMALVAMTTRHLFRAFRTLDRASAVFTARDFRRA